MLSELKIPNGYKPLSSAVFGYKKTKTPNAPERKPNLVTTSNNSEPLIEQISGTWSIDC